MPSKLTPQEVANNRFLQYALEGNVAGFNDLMKGEIKPDLESRCFQFSLTALMCASDYGHLEMVKALLAAGVAVDAKPGDGSTALMHASQDGHLAVVQALLAAGADVNLVNAVGGTSLTVASFWGHLDVVQALLAAGAEVNKKITFIALMCASQNGHLDVVQALLAAGADVNSADALGNTSLMIASYTRRLRVVQALLAAGAKVDQVNQEGCTALRHASESGYLRLVQALLAAGADVNSADALGNTPLMIASSGGHLTVVKALLAAGAEVNKVNREGCTALILASKNNHLEVVQALLARGAVFDLKSEMGIKSFKKILLGEYFQVARLLLENFDFERKLEDFDPVILQEFKNVGLLRVFADNPKMLARLLAIKLPSESASASISMPKIDENKDILFKAVREGNFVEVERILPSYKTLNAVNDKGATALILASLEGHLKIVKALLAAGADVNAKSIDGITALMLATEKGHLDVVKALLAAGADVNALSQSGSTPLMIASQKNDVRLVKVLLAAGADVNQKNDEGISPLILASSNNHLEVVNTLLAAGADVNAADDDGVTVLMFALVNGHLDVVQALLAAGADVNKANKRKCTALIFASEKGYLKQVEALLAAGANVNAVSASGHTALMFASQQGHAEVVSQLLVRTRGAFVDLESEIGVQSFELVLARGHFQVVDLLLKKVEFEKGLKSFDIAILEKFRKAGLVRFFASTGNLPMLNELLSMKADDLDLADEDGNTALHKAAQNKHQAVIDVLLRKGAASIKNKEGKTFVDLIKGEPVRIAEVAKGKAKKPSEDGSGDELSVVAGQKKGVKAKSAGSGNPKKSPAKIAVKAAAQAAAKAAAEEAAAQAAVKAAAEEAAAQAAAKAAAQPAIDGASANSVAALSVSVATKVEDPKEAALSKFINEYETQFVDADEIRKFREYCRSELCLFPHEDPLNIIKQNFDRHIKNRAMRDSLLAKFGGAVLEKHQAIFAEFGLEIVNTVLGLVREIDVLDQERFTSHWRLMLGCAFENDGLDLDKIERSTAINLINRSVETYMQDQLNFLLEASPVAEHGLDAARDPSLKELIEAGGDAARVWLKDVDINDLLKTCRDDKAEPKKKLVNPAITLDTLDASLKQNLRMLNREDSAEKYADEVVLYVPINLDGAHWVTGCFKFNRVGAAGKQHFVCSEAELVDTMSEAYGAGKKEAFKHIVARTFEKSCSVTVRSLKVQEDGFSCGDRVCRYILWAFEHPGSEPGCIEVDELRAETVARLMSVMSPQSTVVGAGAEAVPLALDECSSEFKVQVAEAEAVRKTLAAEAARKAETTHNVARMMDEILKFIEGAKISRSQVVFHGSASLAWSMGEGEPRDIDVKLFLTDLQSCKFYTYLGRKMGAGNINLTDKKSFALVKIGKTDKFDLPVDFQVFTVEKPEQIPEKIQEVRWNSGLNITSSYCAWKGEAFEAHLGHEPALKAVHFVDRITGDPKEVKNLRELYESRDEFKAEDLFFFLKKWHSLRAQGYAVDKLGQVIYDTIQIEKDLFKEIQGRSGTKTSDFCIDEAYRLLCVANSNAALVPAVAALFQAAAGSNAIGEVGASTPANCER